jgi:hypothetical protein
MPSHRPGSLRALGILLFLPVPLVLWLFTRAPLGVRASLGLGVVVMATHRLYARPYALRHAAARCLWCGGASGGGPSLSVQDPLGAVAWRACRADHAEKLGQLLAWASAHARGLKAAILGTLAAFLPTAWLADAGRLDGLRYADVVSLFRLGIAVSVLTLAFRFASAASPAPDRLRSPFPVHIQALVGSAAVLWLFRLVGVVWLVLAIHHGLGRVGLF